jgi:hypothetical protein
MMPTASIHGSQTGYHMVPETIPAVCPPIGDPFLPQFNQFDNYQQACALSAPMPAPMPTSSMVTPMPIQHLHYQPQQLLHATVTGVASPGFVTRGRVTKACEYCKFRKVKCSGGEPCERCTERAIQCVYERRKPRGPAKKRSEMRDVPVQQVSVSSASSMVSVFPPLSLRCFLVLRVPVFTLSLGKFSMVHRPSVSLSPPTLTLGPQPSFHPLLFLPLHPCGQRYSHPCPHCLVPSSRRRLLPHPPWSMPQGRSSHPPPLPSLNLMSLSLYLPRTLNRARPSLRGRVPRSRLFRR